MKRHVHLFQVNNLYAKSAFLPYSVGLLQAYAQKDPVIREEYEFKELGFLREPVKSVVARMDRPSVVGISCYIWNGAYSLALAKAVKEAFPACLVVLGGPHVPVRSEGFFQQHPYADLLVHYEGEQAFKDILLERLNPVPDYHKVKGLTVKIEGNDSHKTGPRDRIGNLDEIPSPYLEGVFDRLLDLPYEFHPSFESDRGCPFSCSFCLSGDSLVNTLYGLIPISELARRFTTVPVFTVDRKTGNLETEIANNIRMTRQNAKLVRVRYSGPHLRWIDCTPDHKFLNFSKTSRRIEDVFEVEAQNLRPGDSILSTNKACLSMPRETHRVSFIATNAVFALDGISVSTVEAVEPIDGLHDVYCLTAPEFGWFFANNVLVKNCDWGSNTLAKMKKYSTERMEEEIEWVGKKRLDLMYGCNANFGIFDRDVRLTEKMVEMKQKYGYPNKFRTAYAKNSGERVYQIAKMLHEAGMNKGVTLSFQSMDEGTLTAVKRKNIGTKMYSDLMQRYRKEGIATYSEIIIGLPGESYESFANGIDSLLNAGGHDGLNVYTCEALPNSELSDPAYRARYGITTIHTPVLFYHATPSPDDHVERYEIVTSTNTLPPEDWLKCELFAWAVQAMHCLPLTQIIAVFLKHYAGVPYRKFYEEMLIFAEIRPDTVLGRAYKKAREFFKAWRDGKTVPLTDERFGPITWPTEEFGFLLCMAEKEKFYNEIYSWILYLVDDHGESYLDDVFEYQQEMIRSPEAPKEKIESASFDVRAYINECWQGKEKPTLTPGWFGYFLAQAKAYSELESYAKECVWYARKGGSFFHKHIERMS